MTHEVTHVVLRRISGNVNDSTPEIAQQSESQHASQETIVHPESGIMSEFKLFGGKVDFVKTVDELTKNKAFDVKLFEQFFDDITKNNRRVPKNKSLYYISKEQFSKMALDIAKQNRRIFE